MKLDIDIFENDQIVSLAKDIYAWPDKLENELIIQNEKHDQERAKLEKLLKEKRIKFQTEVKVYKDDIQEFEAFTIYSSYKQNLEEIGTLEKKI